MNCSDHVHDSTYQQTTLDLLLAMMPKQRRTGLFSATQTTTVNQLVRAGLRNPVRVSVKVRGRTREQKTPATLENRYLVANAEDKLNRLCRFLKEHQEEKVLVYFATCACVEYFGKALLLVLGNLGIQVLSLHGKMNHKRRTKTYERYQTLPAGALLCTDVAARGLDLPDIRWVVQYDPPCDPAAFVHRCGRTARIGRTGSALCFLLPKEAAFVDYLVKENVPLRPYTDAVDFYHRICQLS